MTFVIATDSRKKKEVLFMVDRAKQSVSFWSNRLDDVFQFSDRDAAVRKASTLRFNNPRVLSIEDARIIAGQTRTHRTRCYVPNEVVEYEDDWCESGSIVNEHGTVIA